MEARTGRRMLTSDCKRILRGRGQDMVKRLSGLILIACMTAFSNSAALADDFHYTNLLIGERASGMAGAYTAVSDDATGLYYNPAGTVYTSGRSLSASVNAYYSTTKTYKNVIGGNGWERKSSSLLPNYFGVVQPLGKFKVGLSYAVPESIMSDQEQTFHDLQLNPSLQPFNPGVNITTYLINFNDESNTYNFGPSIAKELTDNFSAGLTLYYYQRKTLRILNQLIKTSNGGSERTTDYFHTSESGVRPILGFMWSPLDNVSVGLAMSKVFINQSETSFHTSFQRENLAVGPNPGDSNAVSLPDAPSVTSQKRIMPKQVSLGAAWFPSASLLLSADLNYFSVKNVGDIVTLKDTKEDFEDVLNFAVGAEYYLSRNFAVRAGFFTDYANTQKVGTGGVNQNEHIDIYGVTASVSHFTGNTAVTVGGGTTYGQGKTQIISGSTAVQTASQQGWLLFLSSSYSY